MNETERLAFNMDYVLRKTEDALRSYDEQMSQPPEVNRCPICGVTAHCPGHQEDDDE